MVVAVLLVVVVELPGGEALRTVAYLLGLFLSKAEGEREESRDLLRGTAWWVTSKMSSRSNLWCSNTGSMLCDKRTCGSAVKTDMFGDCCTLVMPILSTVFFVKGGENLVETKLAEDSPLCRLLAELPESFREKDELREFEEEAWDELRDREELSG